VEDKRPNEKGKRQKMEKQWEGETRGDIKRIRGIERQQEK